MPFVERDGFKIYYQVEGKGPAIVMLYGFMGSMNMNSDEVHDCLEYQKESTRYVGSFNVSHSFAKSKIGLAIALKFSIFEFFQNGCQMVVGDADYGDYQHDFYNSLGCEDIKKYDIDIEGTIHEAIRIHLTRQTLLDSFRSRNGT